MEVSSFLVGPGRASNLFGRSFRVFSCIRILWLATSLFRDFDLLLRVGLFCHSPSSTDSLRCSEDLRLGRCGWAIEL